MDFSRFEMSVDWDLDVDQISLSPKLVHELTKIGEQHHLLCYLVGLQSLAETLYDRDNEVSTNPFRQCLKPPIKRGGDQV